MARTPMNMPNARMPASRTRRAALAGLGALALSPWSRARATAAPRLVTLGGSITEIVYALGAEAQLVGTDSTSFYPPAAAKTPKVGYFRQLSAEGILSLRPDAIVGTDDIGPPAVVEQLRSAGVQVELVRADHSWGEVQRKLQAVGRACGRAAAARALQAGLDDQWRAVQAEVAAFQGTPPRVLFILAHSQSPRVAGTKTAADAMIRFFGGINAMQGFEGYRALTAEGLAQAAPDVILTTDQGLQEQGGADTFWRRPELALTPAYKSRALVTLDALELIGFGPRLPQSVRTLHRRVVLGDRT
ncbi:MAG: ABC transporter substrate-binding protein [Burkholderiaceae bacterium]